MKKKQNPPVVLIIEIIFRDFCKAKFARATDFKVSKELEFDPRVSSL